MGFLSFLYEYGAPLGGPSGRRSSANIGENGGDDDEEDDK